MHLIQQLISNISCVWLGLRNAAQALEEEIRPTLPHEARQALIRAADAECSALMAAMLKRLVFFLLQPIRSKPQKQEQRRSANVHLLHTAITQGAVR